MNSWAEVISNAFKEKKKQKKAKGWPTKSEISEIREPKSPRHCGVPMVKMEGDWVCPSCSHREKASAK